MIDDGVTRRRVLEVGGGVTVASLVLAAGPVAALAQAGSAARATGRPMPDGVELPAAPPRRKRPDSVGFAVVGLGGYLSREMPESISATTFRPAGDPRFAEIFAHVFSQWRFSSGAVAQLATSYDSSGANFFHARGTTGALIMDPATNYSGQKLTLEGRERRDFSPGNPQVQFSRQLDHFADAIRDGTQIRTPGEMGLRDLRLIAAIYASAAAGRIVKLRPDGTMRS